MRETPALCVFILAMGAVAAAVAAERDPTESALERCLAVPANASTAGQTDCEAVAQHSYDQRMNAAYSMLMHRLPMSAANDLRKAQRAWVVFRNAEATARSAIYETRQGTMYVPMQADAATTLIGDRARLLERYARTLDIE